MALTAWLAAGSTALVAEGGPPSTEARERVFFLALDAVPYTAVEALYSNGEAPELFDELGRPRPLISTFPSTTTVALAEALGPFGLEMSPGYEARFFDWRERVIRGGGPISFFRIDFPWRRFFDWTRKSVARSAIASLRPVKVSEKRVLSAFEAFLDSNLRDYFAYVDTTDAAAHLRGPASLNEMFRRLGVSIRRARRTGRSFRIVVYSDHGIAGGEPLENALKGVVASLETSGFRRTKRLRGPRDVVLTPYGLVSSFEAYARHEVTPRLAEVLVSAEGVELCAYRDARELWVVGRAGLASIERRGDLWAYRPRAGDPLRYREILTGLRGAGDPSGETGWFSDRAWFEATRRAYYPDALHRIARGFELVTNPASVICSLEPGYMFGPGRTAAAARLTGGRLRWTHGALHWEASAGFLLTDRAEPGSVEVLRLADALHPLASSPRAASIEPRCAATGPRSRSTSRDLPRRDLSQTSRPACGRADAALDMMASPGRRPVDS